MQQKESFLSKVVFFPNQIIKTVLMQKYLLNNGFRMLLMYYLQMCVL